MKEVEIKAHGKINLTLDVLGMRTDGYHDVEMIMQSIELHDLVYIEKKDEGISITSDSAEIPLDENNLVYKAAMAILNKLALKQGLHINIKKKIPVAAGLAGGSSDAAATLIGINKLMNSGLTVAELMELAASIGSDIPFCITGGTALATGRGELITPLKQLPKQWLVLAKPAIGVSTAQVYKNFKPGNVNKRPDTAAMINAIKMREDGLIKKNLVNVLESVTLNMYPQVREIKSLLIKNGAQCALMSGSGPTVFGISNSLDEAQSLASDIKDVVPVVIVTNTL